MLKCNMPFFLISCSSSLILPTPWKTTTGFTLLNSLYIWHWGRQYSEVGFVSSCNFTIFWGCVTFSFQLESLRKKFVKSHRNQIQLPPQIESMFFFTWRVRFGTPLSRVFDCHPKMGNASCPACRQYSPRLCPWGSASIWTFDTFALWCVPYV